MEGPQARRYFDVNSAVGYAILLMCGCATGAPRGASSTSGSCSALQGSWEGTLPIYREEAKQSATREEVTLRLAFAGDQPKVFLVDRGSWMEAKPGKFVARCLGPSAVVDAIDSASDSDGTWVETWVLAVTVRDAQELAVRWTRMVNNVDLPLTNPSSKFSYQAVGTLQRKATADASAARGLAFLE